MSLTRKLGRKPRAFNPRVPHYSALAARRLHLAPLPPSVDYSKRMPAQLGAMLNDQLGDCTCAAFFHARQLWTANTLGKMQTEPDADVLKLYEAACGYRPDDPSTDQGGVEQGVLTYLLREGAPLGDGTTTDKIIAFVEVDPRNLNDVKRTIYECGVAYIGFQVPSSVLPADGDPPAVWDYDPENADSVGGHAVVLVGYDNVGFKLISWGQVYTMTYRLFPMVTDEVYAIADRAWFNATGKTLLDMSLSDLEAQMNALRGA